MNKIDKLLDELCPEGIDFVKLGEVCEINRGVRVVKKDLHEVGPFPVYQNSMIPLGYSYNSNYPADTTFVISAGSAGEVGYSSVDFWAADDCLCITCPRYISNKFVYYNLLNKQHLLKSKVRKASVPRLSRSAVEKIEIPLPMCKRIMKHQTSKIGDVPFYKIGTFGGKPDAYISRDLYAYYRKSYSFPNKGDILISASGTIGRRVIYDGEDAYFQDSNIVWISNDETKVLNAYLYHLYAVIKWKTEGGTIKRLYGNNISKTLIAVPLIHEQHRIASILDRFERLTTDLQAGLPAEIKARQQQYEYYRDRLLTFKRKTA